MTATPFPSLGCGVGLRREHYGTILEQSPDIDWFEAISENFMIRGGRPLAVLERAREIAPLVLHGVSLSIGSTDPLNEDYLRELAGLAERFEPAWLSDHLCWGSAGGHYAHDLLPHPTPRRPCCTSWRGSIGSRRPSAAGSCSRTSRAT